MKDTAAISVTQFKYTVFMWEVIITIIVFGAAYFILKGFKERETKSKAKNSRYNTGE
jgi:uncharacterized protein YutD